MSRRKKNTAAFPDDDDAYADYVEHPRYGRKPRITGLNPIDGRPGAWLRWGPTDYNIPNTAIAADRSKQVGHASVTHYFDTKRRCRDCGRMFLFFAEE